MEDYETKNSIQHDQNALSDIRTMHDFAYTVPNETREEFQDNESVHHPTASTCKIYKG